MSTRIAALLATIALALSVAFTINVEGAGAQVDQPAKTFGVVSQARPIHSAITAPAKDVCAWTGVRDGVLGFGSASQLVEYYRFWFIDHYWVRCKAKITVSGNVYYHCWIVSTHDGYTIHQGDCDIH